MRCATTLSFLLSARYDAITIDNTIAYQNALNAKNVSFSKACGAVLTNYCWKESDAWTSKQTALEHGLSPDRTFFGVDVWAQNKTTLRHPRVTYPEKGGGGTNTGVAVSKLAEVGLSVGIFAPAWSLEHFPGCGRAVERAMWEGRTLLEDVSCSCGNAGVRHPPNRAYPILQFARQFLAGSGSFFYTDFSRGFGSHGEQEAYRIYNGQPMHSQLASQSVLPTMPRSSVPDDLVEGRVNVVSHRLNDLEGRTHLLIEAQGVKRPKGDTGETCESWLPLFELDMPADGSLRLSISSRHLLQLPDAAASFYLKFSSGTKLLKLEEKDNLQSTEAILHLGSGREALGRLCEIGVHLQAPPLRPHPVQILEVQEIRIVPRSAPSQINCGIHNVRVETRRQWKSEHRRLCWMYQAADPSRLMLLDMPYSDITGPFSHFLVRIDGLHVGRAYALEYVVPQSLGDELAGREVEVEVTGIGFDGRTLAHKHARLRV